MASYSLDQVSKSFGRVTYKVQYFQKPRTRKIFTEGRVFLKFNRRFNFVNY